MIPDEQQQRLKDLQTVFLEENTKLNLSALRDEESVWNGNILDSVAGVEVLEGVGESHKLKILEVGTGGGFPLLPLAICMPEAKFVGLDSTGKKLDAIRRMTVALNINNVELMNGRAEEVAHDPKFRSKFDIVMARALAPLNVLLELCVPFLRIGGSVVAWKSMKIEDELKEAQNAMKELGCNLQEQKPYELPGDWGKRQLLIFRKLKETNAKYPRAVGIPKKSPLL